MPMVKITNVINEKNKMHPSKEVENSLKSFARSYHSVFLKRKTTSCPKDIQCGTNLLN